MHDLFSMTRVQPRSLIRVRSGCDKIAFMPLLTFVVTTLLAQIVLILRFVAPDTGKLRTNRGWIEQNKRRHRREPYNHLWLCFNMLIQLTIWTYSIAIAPPEGGDSTTEYLPQFLPASTLQRNRAHRSQLRSTSVHLQAS